MKEFGLSEAEMRGEGWMVAFRRRPAVADPDAVEPQLEPENANPHPPAAEPVAPAGIPIASPMTGIYYSASSPASPPFVREGDRVEAGQVVALIEAMKVFNEITAPMGGTVLRITVENGSLVQQGDPLVFIG